MFEITVSILLIFTPIALFLAWYFSNRSKEKERLLLIEKGVDLSELLPAPKKSFSFPWLKMGVLITGISIGLLIDFTIRSFGFMTGDPPVVMLLFAGLSMILAHFWGKNDTRKDE
ncbi:MAG: hypothetical protein LAT57_04860 [Balneolales bacterium]|nr:hypothetical protein [Balneolales bacterium]